MDITYMCVTMFVLFLQIINCSNGQTRNLFLNRKEQKNRRFFNPRQRNPRRLANRQLINERLRNSQNIPSFLNDQVAWAYTNKETNIPDIVPIRQTTRRAKRTQYNQKGKVFGHCDIGNDEDLDDLFPGIFQSETEILSETSKVIKKERWHGDAVRTYSQPKNKVPQIVPEVVPKVVETTTQRFARTNNNSEIRDRTRPPSGRNSEVCSCCQTISRHEVYQNITVDETNYQVIQLPGKFQAIPVGRCPVSNLCLYGDCVQHYSVHHVLIWNNTVPYYPPFDFALVEYPTHCTWENIGQ
ncbi:unnamed protein product [Mytilus edulis]|uniref:Uncharacterized protein n=1 Tax=Mytilus edulis TaxID=6550 RepID=A0A8S3V7Q1_MYTED|nr:unnamed protein product [Mytilus edulis]